MGLPEPVIREPVWQLELNKYQRDALLHVLTETEDTGDWYWELRSQLEALPQHERLYYPPGALEDDQVVTLEPLSNKKSN